MSDHTDLLKPNSTVEDGPIPLGKLKANLEKMSEPDRQDNNNNDNNCGNKNENDNNNVPRKRRVVLLSTGSKFLWCLSLLDQPAGSIQ